MEAGFDWDDARVGGLWSLDVAGAHADQLAVAWLFVCGDFRLGIDRRNAFDVGIDRSTLRVQLQKTDSPPPGPPNACSGLQYLLRYLVRIQSSRLVRQCRRCRVVEHSLS